MAASAPSITPEARAAAERERDAFFACRKDKFVNREASEPCKSAKNYSTKWLTIPAAGGILNHMVEYRLDATFHALADPTRRGMLANLALGEKSIGQLAEPFAMTLAGAAKHVRVLEGAGLIVRRKVGRTQLCTLQADPLAEAQVWMRQWEQFWSTRLDRLEGLLANARMLEGR
jgi:DNA-binding transcriptional ArsR family regulator